MLAVCGGLPASHCVGDVLVADRASTIFSGYRLWRKLAFLAGWDVPDRKSPPPSSSSRILGMHSDLSKTPKEPAVVRIAEDRADQILKVFQEVLRRGSLSPSLAGKIWGRLGFAQQPRLMGG